MRLVMRPALWAELGLDDPDKYWLALCCFYLGKGVEETRDVLERKWDDREVQFVLSTAVFCGATKSKDSIKKA